MKNFCLKFYAFMAVVCSVAFTAQTTWKTPATVASSPEVVLSYTYQWITAGRGFQDLKIICQNLTTDKIALKISYDVHFHSGKVETISSVNAIHLKPGETLDPKNLAVTGNTYKRFILSGSTYGTKEQWFQFGKDAGGTPLYSAIHSVMNMRITDLVNLSAKEREAAAKTEREKAEKIQLANARTEAKKQNNTGSAVSEPLPGGETAQNRPQLQESKSASGFSGGLGDIREGEYFRDQNGNYYRKAGERAILVDREEYNRAESQRVIAQLERQEAERKQREAVYTQTANQISDMVGAALAQEHAAREARNEAISQGMQSAEGEIQALMPLARRGNDDAIKKVSSAYVKLGNYMGEFSKGWNGYYAKQNEKFLEEVFAETSSNAARESLIRHYQNQKDAAVYMKKKKVGSALTVGILGAVLAGGGIYIATSDMVTDPDTEDLAMGLALGGGIGGFLLMTVGAVMTSGVSEMGTNSESYKAADQKQKLLQNPVSFRVAPAYHARSKTAMLGLAITF